MLDIFFSMTLGHFQAVFMATERGKAKCRLFPHPNQSVFVPKPLDKHVDTASAFNPHSHFHFPIWNNGAVPIGTLSSDGRGKSYGARLIITEIYLSLTMAVSVTTFWHFLPCSWLQQTRGSPEVDCSPVENESCMRRTEPFFPRTSQLSRL